MSAFLTLDGTDFQVQTAGATEGEPTYVGESARAFDGSYRSGIRGAKRTWTFTLRSMPQADLAALKTLVGLEASLTATGEFVGGESVPVVARIGSTPYTQDGVTFKRVATLTLIEK